MGTLNILIFHKWTQINIDKSRKSDTSTGFICQYVIQKSNVNLIPSQKKGVTLRSMHTYHANKKRQCSPTDYNSQDKLLIIERIRKRMAWNFCKYIRLEMLVRFGFDSLYWCNTSIKF